MSLSSASEDKKLGGTMAQGAGPSWPQGHSIPQNAMLSIQTEGGGCKGLTTAQGQAGHCSVGVEKLYCACFLELIFITTIIIITSSSSSS